MPDLHPLNILNGSQREAWDTRYRMKGRQWGNAPSEYPEIPDSGVILELGVGDGKNLRARSESGAFIIGLDFSKEALRICREDPALSDIPLILADACYLPIRDGSVNSVYANHILGHVSAEMTPVFIAGVFCVLKTGGLLALTVFAEGDMRDKTGTAVESSAYVRGDGIITRYYTEENIRKTGQMFIIRNINRVEWSIRILGKDFKRAVFTALWEKP